MVNLDRQVEERLRLAQAPRRRHGGLEVALGEEVNPFAIRTPGWTGAVDPVAGERRRAAGFEVIQPDLGISVVGDSNVGQPLAVRGPGEISERSRGRRGDALRLFFVEVENPELPVFVAKRHRFAVGRWHAFETENLAIA